MGEDRRQWPENTVEIPKMTTRCRATRRDGTQCRSYALRGAAVCRMHGGAAKQVRRKAAARIEASLDRAAIAVVRLMESEDTPHAVKLAAAKDLMDRGGLTAATALIIAQGEAPWQLVLQQALVVVSEDTDTDGDSQPPPSIEQYTDIVDAELVEDEYVPDEPRERVSVSIASLDDTPPAHIDPDGYHRQSKRRTSRVTRG